MQTISVADEQTQMTGTFFGSSNQGNFTDTQRSMTPPPFAATATGTPRAA